MADHLHLCSSGWKLLPFLLLVCPGCCLPDGDLCRWMNGRKYYIDVGESGIISAENVTSQTATSGVGKEPGSANEPNQPQIPQRCSVELITCPSCHFEVKALRLNIPTCSSDKSCRCDFVWVKEAAYSKSGQEFCGYLEGNTSEHVFESKTKLVSVDFLYSGTYTSAFALQFSAIKNVYVFKGGYEYYPNNSTGEISSPNFPGGYPSDYSAEYIIQNVDLSGFVQLLFTDFQLSLWSYMEILDSNGSRIDVYNGNTFRPPALISSGPSMTVKFQANDEYPSSGFLATYTFVGHADKYWINRPSTECGGFVEDYGGAITMMNMVPSTMMRAFDCIWLVHPRNAHVPGKQISVRVSQFDEMGAKSTLSIRQGLYSRSPLLETVTPFHHHKLHRGQEYVVPASTGLYIRLMGYFNNKSHLAIIYSTFHYDSCYAVGDFECGNGRCIKNSLRCDGFNHCGDGTDESSCYGAQQGTQSPEDANWWRTLTPNYYFPKSDSGNNTGTNTLILVTSLAGLGMFVLTTVVILVKLHKQRQDDNISREILQTISADIDAENAAHHHLPTDPPMYDPPPSYDDVIKFYLPPPPAYSSVGPNHGLGRSGSEHRDDGGAPAPKARVKRKKQLRTLNSTRREAQPVVLRVALPEEGDEERRATPVGQEQATSSGRPPEAPTCPVTSNVREASHQSSHSQKASHKDGRWKHGVTTRDSHDSTTETLVPCEFQSSLSQERFDRNKSPDVAQLRQAAVPASCECLGACSCSSNGPGEDRPERTKQADCQTSRTLETEIHVNRSQSFGDPASSEAGHRAPAASSNELAPVNRPSRSKSFTTESRVSASRGPSFQSASTSGSSSGDLQSKASLQRSSSGPSEVQHSSRQESREAPENQTNMSQVKNFASAIFGGLQQSIFRNACSDSAIGDDQPKLQGAGKSEKTSGGGGGAQYAWGNLWPSARKKGEKDDQFSPTSISSDTQPLIKWALTKSPETPVQQNATVVDSTQKTDPQT